MEDSVVWKGSNGKKVKFSLRSVWEIFNDNNDVVNWHKAVWFPQCNPRHAFILWLSLHGRLATQDRIMVWNKQSSLICPLCKTVNDSHEHLFFNCSYSGNIWNEVKTNAKMFS